jgi:hypothetical protein
MKIFPVASFVSSLLIGIHLNTLFNNVMFLLIYIYISRQSNFEVGESYEITRLWVTIATNCQSLTLSMNVGYVVGHERESNLLFRCIVSSMSIV